MGYLAPVRCLFVLLPAAVLVAVSVTVLAGLLFATSALVAILGLPLAVFLRVLGFALDVLGPSTEGSDL